jgi:regulatory protein
VPAEARGEPPDPAAGPDADPESVARAICLRLLAGAPRTRAQLAAAMRRRGVPEQVAVSVLARYAEVGLVDDSAFAESYVAQRSGSRAAGRRAIAAQLREKGVADEVAAAALEAIDPDAEAAAAAAFARSRLRRLGGLSREVATRRLYGQLSRRGYPANLVAKVVREVLAEGGNS